MGTRGRPRHPDVLTPREWEVAALVRRGLSNTQIGSRLGISHAGAKYHVGEILGKLGVRSRLDAAALLSAGEGAVVPSLWRREEPVCDNRCVDNRPIGFFDSGVGGLTIWRATKRLLSNESLIFLADSGHVPYGEKSTAELRDLAARITRFLLDQEAKLIVVACNTATVHAISYLRETFPEVAFVGVVPVVKTLARATRSGTIAVLSTPATAASPYLSGLFEEFASDLRVINVGCDGLEDLVEEGRIRSKVTTDLLERHLTAVRESKADVVGLGCTHYPFLRQRIKRILGPGVRVYDPSRPVARRVREMLARTGGFAEERTPSHRFYTTGDPAVFQRVATTLLRSPVDDVGYVDLGDWDSA